MAHEIQSDDSLFLAGQPAWHGLGKVVETELTAADAIQAAGLDWEVATKSLYAGNNEDEDLSFVPGHKAVVRKTDSKVLGVVGDRYQPIQNKNCFNFFDSVVGEGKAIYHTAGSLFGGKKVWILAKLPGEIIVGKGDVTHKFLLLSNTHDGSGTLRMLFSPIRVVCNNTLSMALGAGIGQGISIRHTASAEERLKVAADAIDSATEFYDAFNNHAMLLANTKYSAKKLQALVEELFPVPANTEDVAGCAATHKQNRVIELFETGLGHDKIAGSAWAALQAVAEYGDYHTPMNKPNKDKQLDSIWFGKSASIKQRAYDIINAQIAA